MTTTAGSRSVKDMFIEYFQGFSVLKKTRSEYWGVQTINFIDCTFYFAMLSISTIFLSYDLGFDNKDAGYVVTVFTSTTTLFLLISGAITDWLGIRRSIYIAMGGMLLLRLLVTVAGLVDSFPYRGWVVAGAFFLMAPFMAMIQTVFQAANKRYTTASSRSAGFSLWYLMMNIGAACAGFLIDIIRKILEIPNAHIFTFGVIASVLSLITALLLIRNENQLRDDDEPVAPKDDLPAPKKNPWQIAKAVLSESVFWRFLVLIALLLGVRAVFSYMYLLMPKFWYLTIGEDVAMGTLQAINPILIVIGIPLFLPFANRYNIFKMLVYGSMISACSLVFIAIPFGWVGGDLTTFIYAMSIISLVALSIGEIVWSPKLSEYTAAIAPEGQEGTYLGLSMIPWFLAKTIVSLISGHLLDRFVPPGTKERLISGDMSYWDSPFAMWLILAIVAFAGPLVALLFRGWITRGARWKT